MPSISPTIDAIAGEIMAFDAFVQQLDGQQPIVVTIGDHSVTVDPVQLASVYNAGADFLRGAFSRAILDGRQALADATLATVAAPAPSI